MSKTLHKKREKGYLGYYTYTNQYLVVIFAKPNYEKRAANIKLHWRLSPFLNLFGYNGKIANLNQYNALLCVFRSLFHVAKVGSLEVLITKWCNWSYLITNLLDGGTVG